MARSGSASSSLTVVAFRQVEEPRARGLEADLEDCGRGPSYNALARSECAILYRRQPEQRLLDEPGRHDGRNVLDRGRHVDRRCLGTDEPSRYRPQRIDDLLGERGVGWRANNGGSSRWRCGDGPSAERGRDPDLLGPRGLARSPLRSLPDIRKIVHSTRWRGRRGHTLAPLYLIFLLPEETNHEPWWPPARIVVAHLQK
jgi:hypothetical protein